MLRHLAADDHPGAAKIQNGLHIVWPERPRTPKAWAEAGRDRNPRLKVRRLETVKEQGITDDEQKPIY